MIFHLKDVHEGSLAGMTQPAISSETVHKRSSIVFNQYYRHRTTFCRKGWSFWSTSKRDSCHKYLRSASITNSANCTKYTVYPGECINLEDFTDLNNDITSETNLQVSVLSGDIQTIDQIANVIISYHLILAWIDLTIDHVNLMNLS